MKFEWNWTIPDRVTDNLANFCTSYVTLWSWPLTHWPWTLLVDWVSCDQTLCTKVERNRTIPGWVYCYWRFCYFLRGRTFKLYSSEKVDQTAPNLKLHQARNFDTDWLLCVEMRVAQSSGVEINAKFHTFWPPVKIRGGVRKIISWRSSIPYDGTCGIHLTKYRSLVRKAQHDVGRPKHVACAWALSFVLSF